MKRFKYMALAALVAFAACDEGTDAVVDVPVTGDIAGVVTIEGAAVSGVTVALSSGATTNWLILAHPNLYLHACLLYAAEFVKDGEQLAIESTFVQNYVDLLHAADTRGKFANAGVTLRGNVP